MAPPTAPQSAPSGSASPTEKVARGHWWKFPWRNDEKTRDKLRSVNGDKPGVFGVHLADSLKYASVAISMVKPEDGKTYIYGYIPVVVAKCGLFLKENAVDTEGVFRVSGSAKRMKELQSKFDTPPKYGKDLQWSTYSVHDAASVLRRYLNMMPEPVIPYELYNSFRDCLTQPGQSVQSKIQQFHLLLLAVPPSSQCLLLYVLDLLSVFARNSTVNLMTASNLAVVFQPGLVRPPETDLNYPMDSSVHDIKALAGAEAKGHKQSQEILEFFIEHQDHFIFLNSATPTVVNSTSTPISNSMNLPPDNAGLVATVDSVASSNTAQSSTLQSTERPSTTPNTTTSDTLPKQAILNRKSSGKRGNKLRKSVDNHRAVEKKRDGSGDTDEDESGRGNILKNLITKVTASSSSTPSSPTTPLPRPQSPLTKVERRNDNGPTANAIESVTPVITTEPSIITTSEDPPRLVASSSTVTTTANR